MSSILNALKKLEDDTVSEAGFQPMIRKKAGPGEKVRFFLSDRSLVILITAMIVGIGTAGFWGYSHYAVVNRHPQQTAMNVSAKPAGPGKATSRSPMLSAEPAPAPIPVQPPGPVPSAKQIKNPLAVAHSGMPREPAAKTSESQHRSPAAVSEPEPRQNQIALKSEPQYPAAMPNTEPLQEPADPAVINDQPEHSMHLDSETIEPKSAGAQRHPEQREAFAPEPERAVQRPGKQTPVPPAAGMAAETEPDAPELENSDVILQAISWSSTASKRIAVINGQICREGDKIDRFILRRINPEDIRVSDGRVNWKVVFQVK